MIAFPSEFVKTQYYGYFWNLKTNQLFTTKITGKLRPLKQSTRRFGIVNGVLTDYGDGSPYYRISVNGAKRNVNKSYLQAQAQKSKASRFFVTESVDFQ
jgi:hypothetical protein